MYYETNVALKVNGKYQHYFATAERSIDNEEKAVHIANELQEMYDEKFGIDNVRVTITKWQKNRKRNKSPLRAFFMVSYFARFGVNVDL